MALDGVKLFDAKKIQMLMFVKQSNFWRHFFSAKVESWKKMRTSNMVLSFISS